MSTQLPTPAPAEPLRIVADWLATVTASGKRRNPNAMALATADAAGRPSVRMVLLKELAPAGYAVLYTNYGSRKARELAANAQAAAVLYWEELGRQVRFEGRVVESPAEESDRYFATRPFRSQLNAWSSRQSAPLPDPADLERRALEKAREIGVEDLTVATATDRLARPPFWGGYRLWLEAVELWAEGVDRFHERLRYERTLTLGRDGALVAGPWSSQRLQP